MEQERVLREHLVRLLTKRQAHIGWEDVVTDFPVEHRGSKPDGAPHTPWQLLEHMRIAQWDILEFSRNPDHASPDFPDGYWPGSDAPPNETAWQSSIDAFRSDLQAMVALVEDPRIDLLAPIPHGDGQTILREAMLLADHNAYHLGQLVLVKRLLSVA